MKNRPAPNKACVLTIGKFEGIHLGHRALLEEIARRAESLGLASVAIVFEPHPHKFLRDPGYKPIFTACERESLIRETGIGRIVTYNFDAELTAMTAPRFCQKIFETMNPREIIIGENYRFGHNREGTIETLRKEAARHGCDVRVFETVGGISTSKIRELLNANQLKKAAELLGFPFFISGEATKGRQLGRVLGFPTINIYPPPDKFLPQNGVYETRASINGIPGPMHGLTNIGLRPTVSSPPHSGEAGTQISVETHIPVFPAALGELYGKQIKVELTRFIRPERRFQNTDELQAQIIQDLKELSK